MGNVFRRRASQKGDTAKSYDSTGALINPNAGRESAEQHNCQKQISYIDDIVHRWIRKMWDYTKGKDQAKIPWDELNLDVNWNKVDFNYGEAQYQNESVAHMPKSRMLFRTSFTNNTDNVQEYTCRAERSTTTDLHVNFSKSIRRETENFIQFKLPQEIVEVGGGVSREQTIEAGVEKTYSNNVTWAVEHLFS